MADVVQRGFATLQLKGFGDDRTFSGVASTPNLDRDGDVLLPRGAVFDALSVPILLDHNSTQAVGSITSLTVDDRAIRFTARIADIPEKGPLKDLCDSAWQMVKNGLRKAVSVGFRILPDGFEQIEGGLRITAWELLELSLVAIPANADARILQAKSVGERTAAIKSAFADEDAPQGDHGKAPEPVAMRRAKAAAPDAGTPSKSPNTKDKAVAQTIAEQIDSFTKTVEIKTSKMDSIMQEAAQAGETLSADEAEAFDTLAQEIADIETHIKRLKSMEARLAASAVEVTQQATETPKKAAETRKATTAARAKAPDLPKGTAFTRYVLSLAKAHGNTVQAAELAKRYDDSTPEVGRVLKAAVSAGTTTDPAWAAPLVDYANLTNEFIELLRPATVLGRIDGLRRVPFNVKIPAQASGSSVNWVGEGAPKPVSSLAFNTITLGHAKAAGIVALTDELVRMSNPSAEALVRQDLIDAMAEFSDKQFLDPAIAENAGVSPASVTNGVKPIAASGTSADALRVDVRSAFAGFIAANQGVAGAVWVFSPQLALSISMMQNALGQPDFPGINLEGGTFFGLPVILSENVPNGQMTLIKPSEILFADDGETLIDASREASLQLDDAPGTGAQPMVSMFQSNMVAIRAERYMNWKKRRNEAVQIITGAAYA